VPRSFALREVDVKRIGFFVFGVACHAMFLVVFLYMAGFVGNLLVPKSIDSPPDGTPPAVALLVDVLLLGLFAVPHSVMARPAFKRWWTRYVPQALERSVYVLVANLCVALLMWQWRPIGPNLWDVQHPLGRALVYGVFAGGWLLVPVTSLMINHFDLFGSRQVWLHLRQKQYSVPAFRTPMLYKLVRHPLYLGWMIAFWATPTMSAGHVLFAAVLTTYMLVAIPIEERDLAELYGEKYEQYRRRVPALIPRPTVLAPATATAEAAVSTD
jgi:protein-S-isoprenylcysteine O-methyltransferase Ste14